MDETQPIVYRYNPDMNPDGAVADIILLQAKCRGGPPNLPTKLKFHRPQYTFTAS